MQAAPIDLRAVLHKSKVDDLFAVLSRAEASLRSLPPALLPAVAARLDATLEGAGNSLRRIETLDPTSPVAWSEMLAASIQVADLGQECLELAQGAVARGGELEGEICAMGDRLVLESIQRLALPSWISFCIPGETDGYSRRTKVIHIGVGARLAPDAVWSLPSVSHELGHQVAPLVTRTAGTTVVHEVNDVLRQAGQQDRVLAAHLGEIFADSFAAFTMGPAYGFAAAWRGFGSGRLDDPVETPTHPSPADRVRQIVSTLHGLDDIGDTADWVSRLWVDGAPAEARGEVSDRHERLDDWSDRLREILHRCLGAGRYNSWHIAIGLAGAFASGISSPMPADDGGAGRATVTDAVNAAWWARLHHPSEAGRISAKAWALLQ